MAENINIPQGFFDDETDPKPCWISIVTGEARIPCKPAIRCQCGEVTNIALHHVHADGRVTNSFYHTNGNPCGWHVFLFLDGYREKVGIDFPPEQ